MDVQCKLCGQVQPFDAEYPICLKCGNKLDPRDSRLIKNLRRGVGLQAFGILGFLGFLAFFLFYSKYVGGYGMAVSTLFYFWGLYKRHLIKKEGQTNDLR